MHTINFYSIKTKQSISESLSGLIEESDTLEILYRCEHLCWNAKMDHLGLVFGHGPRTITGKINLEEWAKQADQYEDIRNDGFWNQALQVYAIAEQSHPFSAVRVREILDWSKTEHYQSIKRYLLLGDNVKRCPHCGRPIEDGWRYCKYCGGKV